jgi:hypothetical protein
MPNVVKLTVAIFNVMLSVAMPSVSILRDTDFTARLSGIMLSVVLLNVLGPVL